MGYYSNHFTSARLKGIYRESMCLRNKGWHVMANIPGYDTPPEIEGFVPDIYAIKENKTIIFMIESEWDSDADRTQSFKKYSFEFDNMFFITYLVNASGCRLEKVCQNVTLEEVL